MDSTDFTELLKKNISNLLFELFCGNIMNTLVLDV